MNHSYWSLVQLTFIDMIWYYYDNDNDGYQQESWFLMDSNNDNEKRELPSNIKTKLFCMFDLLFCASFYNHLKILPLISCTTIVLKHALLESKHDTASKHKTHRSQIASGELLSCTEPTHTEGDNCDRHSRESENLGFIFVRWLFYMLLYLLDYWTPQ